MPGGAAPWAGKEQDKLGISAVEHFCTLPKQRGRLPGKAFCSVDLVQANWTGRSHEALFGFGLLTPSWPTGLRNNRTACCELEVFGITIHPRTFKQSC